METVISPIDFKDRKNALVVFGIFTMLMGGFCALLVPLILFSQSMAAKSGTAQSGQAIFYTVLICGLLAVVLVWLGIGSTMSRRWARALMLIFSWIWLITGVLSVLMMGLMLPRAKMTMTVQAANQPGQSQVTSEMQSGSMVVTLIIMGVIFVILPAVWVLFYLNRNVKATCEMRDPVVRWTDRCPLPVLAASLWMASSVPIALVAPGPIPVFGMFASGALGFAISILLAVVWGYCAWAFYKLDRRVWWIFTGFFVLFAISGLISYSRRDPSEVYALMGYSSEKIAQLQKFSLFEGKNTAWVSLLYTAPILGYLIYLRRFFPRPHGEIRGGV